MTYRKMDKHRQTDRSVLEQYKFHHQSICVGPTSITQLIFVLIYYTFLGCELHFVTFGIVSYKTKINVTMEISVLFNNPLLNV